MRSGQRAIRFVARALRTERARLPRVLDSACHPPGARLGAGAASNERDEEVTIYAMPTTGVAELLEE
jgi:hypothetical protein